MYRNYMQRGCCHSCKCSCHNEQECDKHEDIIDDTCKCVQNIVDCSDECECGFDEEDKLFPASPMFGQSYVPWQIMDKTYTPCVRLKNGNNISRACKSLYARTIDERNRIYQKNK